MSTNTTHQDFLNQCSQCHQSLLSASQKMGECFLETLSDYVSFGAKHMTQTPKTPEGFVNMCYELNDIQVNAYQKTSNAILENFAHFAERNPVAHNVMNSVKSFTQKTTNKQTEK